MECANIFILNTCCVRENAEEKLFGKLGELKKLKQKNNMIIGIGGCMRQEKHIVDKLKQSYPQVDIIFGTHTIHKLPEGFRKVIKQEEEVQDILEYRWRDLEGLPFKRENRKSASLQLCMVAIIFVLIALCLMKEEEREVEERRIY